MKNRLDTLFEKLKVPKKPNSNPLGIKIHTRLASILPSFLVFVFVCILWVLFADQMITGKEVRVFRVVTTTSNNEPQDLGNSDIIKIKNSDLYEGEVLFQASGWLEADPFPIRAFTLYGGIVEEVFVQEGDRVEKGQLLARMVGEDATLDCETAQANLAETKAFLDVQLSAVDGMRARLNSWQMNLDTAKSRKKELLDDAIRYREAGPEIVPGREIAQSQLRLETQDTLISSLNSERRELEVQLNSRLASVRQQQGRVAKAETEVARMQLALNRTQIKSPDSGIIQRLYAEPGMKRMLHMDHPESSTIALIFKPEALRVRMDIPIEEVSQLFLGQAVLMRIRLFPNKTFKGSVTQISGEADLQRNTLEVKVRIYEPDEKLRPEMLCRGEFLGKIENLYPNHLYDKKARIGIFVKKEAVLKSGDETLVWRVDSSGNFVKKQTVKIVPKVEQGHYRVLKGLKPGDRVLIDSLEDISEGDRIRPIYN